MLFLVDEKKKVIFGWNAKCGCSHLKNLFHFLTDDKFSENNNDMKMVHRDSDYRIPKLLDTLDKYTIIMVIRNPYERLISGFLDKFREKGEAYTHLGAIAIPRFSNLITYFEDNRYINCIWFTHHFYPQTYIRNKNKLHTDILNHKDLIVYDLANIDYNFIETLYKKEIPVNLKNFIGSHQTSKLKPLDKNVFDLLLSEYNGYRPYTKCFYNEDIKARVDMIFKDDFKFFTERGFNYQIS